MVDLIKLRTRAAVSDDEAGLAELGGIKPQSSDDSVPREKHTPCPLCHDRHEVFLEARGGWVPCPKCGGVVAEIKKDDDPVQIDLLNWLRIPEVYRKRLYIRDAIMENKAKGRWASQSVEKTLNAMDDIYNGISDMSILRDHLYISTRGSWDMLQFVYGCQQMALMRDLSTVPYISANVLADLINGKSMNFQQQTIEEYYKIAYEDYIECAVCFIDATASTNYYGWNAIADLLTERDRANKPLYVTGYWNADSVPVSGAKFILDTGKGRTNMVALNVCEFLAKTQRNEAVTIAPMQTEKSPEVPDSSVF